MSGFDDINEAIEQGGGSFYSLKKTSDAPLVGTLVDVDKRTKMFKGEVVYSTKTKKPRVEWLFTVDTADGTVKWAAGEAAQIAITDELKRMSEKAGDRVKLQAGGKIKVTVTEDSVQGKKQAQVTFEYKAPEVKTILADDEGLPF